MVAELVSVTVTWGRAAPPGSVTAPARAPVVADWQCPGEGQATASRVGRMAASSSLRRSGGIGYRIVTREPAPASARSPPGCGRHEVAIMLACDFLPPD